MHMYEMPFVDLCDSFVIGATGKRTQVQVFLLVCQSFFVMMLKFHYHDSLQSLN